MTLSRRQLLQAIGAGALAATGARSHAAATVVAPSPPDFADLRGEFPWLARKVWLAAAEFHPFSVHTLRAIERYTAYRSQGPGDGRETFTADQQAETKRLFAALVNARPEEIAFVQGTTDGENIIVAGMGLPERGGNIVIDDLHFDASKYLYRTLEQTAGLELRVVRHRDWIVDPADMDRAIDRNTRLVSMALVSNINGYLHDVKTVSQLAHERGGAYVYADIIQAAGATPIDVKAMGIDFAACSTYKWLMGDFGFGFLYVREDLQGTVVRPTRYGLRQVTNRGGLAFEPRPGAVRFEGTTTISNLSGVCAYEGVKNVARLGVNNIRTHAKSLTDRLQREMPALGYLPMTPPDNPTPIVSFITRDAKETQAKLDRAFGERVVSLRRWQGAQPGASPTLDYLRIGVSVYNNHQDLDTFLEALD